MKKENKVLSMACMTKIFISLYLENDLCLKSVKTFNSSTTFNFWNLNKQIPPTTLNHLFSINVNNKLNVHCYFLLVCTVLLIVE